MTLLLAWWKGLVSGSCMCSIIMKWLEGRKSVITPTFPAAATKSNCVMRQQIELHFGVNDGFIRWFYNNPCAIYHRFDVILQTFCRQILLNNSQVLEPEGLLYKRRRGKSLISKAQLGRSSLAKHYSDVAMLQMKTWKQKVKKILRLNRKGWQASGEIFLKMSGENEEIHYEVKFLFREKDLLLSSWINEPLNLHLIWYSSL